MLILLFGVQACLVIPYLEWLGVAEKTQGHGFGYGLVRCRIPYYCVGGFFSCPFPVPSLPLFPGVLGGAERKTVLGQVLVPFLGFSLGILGRLLSSAWALGPNEE